MTTTTRREGFDGDDDGVMRGLGAMPKVRVWAVVPVAVGMTTTSCARRERNDESNEGSVGTAGAR